MIAAGLAASTVSSHAQGALASATIYGVAVSGGYDYTISLGNNGTEDLNTFWYGWTFDGNNLPSDPSDVANNLGWDNELSGNSIIWANSSGSALAPGQTGTFTFFSTDSPADITTSPSGGSYVYTGNGIFNGDSAGPFSPSLVSAPVPEPPSCALLVAGILGGLALVRGRSGRLALARNA